mgnify:CR=1 FL=1
MASKNQIEPQMNYPPGTSNQPNQGYISNPNTDQPMNINPETGNYITNPYPNPNAPQTQGKWECVSCTFLVLGILAVTFGIGLFIFYLAFNCTKDPRDFGFKFSSTEWENKGWTCYA